MSGEGLERVLCLVDINVQRAASSHQLIRVVGRQQKDRHDISSVF